MYRKAEEDEEKNCLCDKMMMRAEVNVVATI